MLARPNAISPSSTPSASPGFLDQHPERVAQAHLPNAARFRNLSIGTFVGAGVLAAGSVATLVLWNDKAADNRKHADDTRVTFAPLLGPLNGFAVSADSKIYAR